MQDYIFLVPNPPPRCARSPSPVKDGGGSPASVFALVFVAALLGAVPLAPYVGVAACVGQVALNVAVLRRQAAVFTWLMTGASVALAVGAAAWAVTRFRFPGKSLLITFIDLPFAVSPFMMPRALSREA